MATRVAGLKRWWWIPVFWAAMAVLVASQVDLDMRDHGHSYWRMVSWHLLAFGVWAVYTPLVLRLGRRVRLDGAARWRGLSTHLALALALALVHVATLAWLAPRVRPFDPIPMSADFADQFVFQSSRWLHVDLMIYVAIAGVAQALDYRSRHHRRQLREAHLREELTEARLRMLELELEPHFLFNTLNGIVSLVRSGANREAEEMLVGLSELLRATLDQRGRQEVLLDEELELVERYLAIQKARFGERLVARFEVAPETRQAAVPSLILQPLLENAIRYGIAGRVDGGRVTIAAARENGQLRLSVADDGPGFGPDALPEASAEGAVRGIGLENTRSRIATLYGPDGGMELMNGGERGATVVLSIPWRHLDGEERTDGREAAD